MMNILLAVYAVITSTGLISIKLGTKHGALFTFANGKPHLQLNFFIFSGIVMYGLSFLLYTYLISKNDLGYIIPLTTALVYILIFVASFFILHEAFTVTKVIGITLIIAGLIFLNLHK